MVSGSVMHVSSQRFRTQFVNKHLKLLPGGKGFSSLRDEDTPMSPLPDGSGAINSGVISQTSTRGYQGIAEHQWTLSPAMLNQARFGYTRRGLDQTSLQNGNVTVPGVPANSFASVLPIFAVAGYQQIGPTSSANARFRAEASRTVSGRKFQRHSIMLRIEV